MFLYIYKKIIVCVFYQTKGENILRRIRLYYNLTFQSNYT